MKLYARIVWLGDNLRRVTHNLLHRFRNEFTHKSFIVLHWTPSEIIDSGIDYDLITMPRCEEFSSEDSQKTMCKYELTPILKYCSLQMNRAPQVHSTFSLVSFERNSEKYILDMYNNATEINDNVIGDEQPTRIQNKEDIYEAIACKFLKTDKYYRELVLRSKTAIRQKRKVYIGGLYPKHGEAEQEYKGWVSNNVTVSRIIIKSDIFIFEIAAFVFISQESQTQ